MEIKVGDKVRVKGCGYEPNLHKGDVGEILDTNDKGQCFVLFKKSQAWIYADCLEPYTEPCVDRINFAKRRGMQQAAHKAIVDEFYDKPFDWDAYTADLTKEIALKVANRYNNPEEVADYAVKVAKAVAEGLKKQ